ncbi:serine/threonine-protein kinase bud32 [Saitoella coloradoensis]
MATAKSLARLDGLEKTLIKQGAEALAYKTTFLTPDTPALLKVRPKKEWRHPTLDARLTKHRVLAEARLLVKCKQAGVPVPGVYFIDEARGEVWMEWIEGRSVRDALQAVDSGAESEDTVGDAGKEGLFKSIGRALAVMHETEVVHGDLTTSNLMLTPAPENKVVIIDFGLGSVSISEEDKAVDLYVLERAFASTHPKSEAQFEKVLEGYQEAYPKGSRLVLKRLEDVRMRGRKRSMLG